MLYGEREPIQKGYIVQDSGNDKARVTVKR